MRDDRLWTEGAELLNHADLSVVHRRWARWGARLSSMKQVSKCARVCAWERFGHKRPSSMLGVDNVHCFWVSKKNNSKFGNCLCLCACGYVCTRHLLSEERKSRKGQNSTLISSTYGRVSHISLIRFVGISCPPPLQNSQNVEKWMPGGSFNLVAMGTVDTIGWYWGSEISSLFDSVSRKAVDEEHKKLVCDWTRTSTHIQWVVVWLLSHGWLILPHNPLFSSSDPHSLYPPLSLCLPK